MWRLKLTEAIIELVRATWAYRFSLDGPWRRISPLIRSAPFRINHPGVASNLAGSIARTYRRPEFLTDFVGS